VELGTESSPGIGKAKAVFTTEDMKERRGQKENLTADNTIN
jgi:hypothetical protein